MGLRISRSGGGVGVDEGGTCLRPRGAVRVPCGPAGLTATAGQGAVCRTDDAGVIRECRPGLRGARPSRGQRSVQTQ